MSANSDKVFHGAKHRQTAPFGEWRDNHTRQHKGTDYGTYQKNLEQFALGNGVVEKIVLTETNGNLRGIYVDVYYPSIGKNIIAQHLLKATVAKGQEVNSDTVIGYTGDTGKYASGKKVSSGIHAHIEVYDHKTKVREDFELLDLTEVDDMNEKDVLEILDGSRNTTSTWATEGVKWAVTNKLIADDKLLDRRITKEELAVILNRFYKLLKG